jgi:hypothetical protein
MDITRYTVEKLFQLRNQMSIEELFLRPTIPNHLKYIPIKCCQTDDKSQVCEKCHKRRQIRRPEEYYSKKNVVLVDVVEKNRLEDRKDRMMKDFKRRDTKYQIDAILKELLPIKPYTSKTFASTIYDDGPNHPFIEAKWNNPHLNITYSICFWSFITGLTIKQLGDVNQLDVGMRLPTRNTDKEPTKPISFYLFDENELGVSLIYVTGYISRYTQPELKIYNLNDVYLRFRLWHLQPVIEGTVMDNLTYSQRMINNVSFLSNISTEVCVGDKFYANGVHIDNYFSKRVVLFLMKSCVVDVYQVGNKKRRGKHHQSVNYVKAVLLSGHVNDFMGGGRLVPVRGIGEMKTISFLMSRSEMLLYGWPLKKEHFIIKKFKLSMVWTNSVEDVWLIEGHESIVHRARKRFNIPEEFIVSYTTHSTAVYVPQRLTVLALKVIINTDFLSIFNISPHILRSIMYNNHSCDLFERNWSSEIDFSIMSYRKCDYLPEWVFPKYFCHKHPNGYLASGDLPLFVGEIHHGRCKVCIKLEKMEQEGKKEREILEKIKKKREEIGEID